MVSTRYLASLVAASMVSMVTAQGANTAEDGTSSVVSIATPTASIPLNAMSTIGCFSTGVPLEDHGYYLYQSSGNCQGICALLNKPVLGLTDGTNCWCGDEIPPKDSQIDNSTCSTTCSGTKLDTCGGDQAWWVILTGTTRNKVQYYSAASSSSDHSTITAAPQSSTVVQAGQTVVVTASQSSSSKSKDSGSGANKTGIAVGVVVGVIALAAIIGAIVFVLKRKKRRDVEEEYKQRAAVNSFVAGGKLHTSNSSMTDSRLDPEFNARRQSNGSIADNEDYSRRILKVTNA